MEESMFLPDQFITLEDFAYKDVFSNVVNVWDVIGKLGEFIEEQFRSGKVIPNHSENVYVGEGTTIENGVFIKGPAIIGKNTRIGLHSFIRENCIIGDNVNIGFACEVKNSVFLNGAIAAHLNYVGDSIIGNQANISGGAKLASFRLDKKNVTVRVNDKKIDTGLQKFGAVVGDNSMIGANSILNPGTLLGKNTIVYPLVSVVGVHKDGQIIR